MSKFSAIPALPTKIVRCNETYRDCPEIKTRCPPPVFPTSWFYTLLEGIKNMDNVAFGQPFKILTPWLRLTSFGSVPHNDSGYLLSFLN